LNSPHPQTRRPLWAPVREIGAPSIVVLSVVLALAGCGGGSTSAPTTSTPAQGGGPTNPNGSSNSGSATSSASLYQPSPANFDMISCLASGAQKEGGPGASSVFEGGNDLLGGGEIPDAKTDLGGANANFTNDTNETVDVYFYASVAVATSQFAAMRHDPSIKQGLTAQRHGNLILIEPTGLASSDPNADASVKGCLTQDGVTGNPAESATV
jgi:hypothetical protein